MGRRRWRKLFGTDGGMAEGQPGAQRREKPEEACEKDSVVEESLAQKTPCGRWIEVRRVLRLLGGDSMTFFFLSAKGIPFFWGCLKQGQGVLAAVWNRVSSLVGPWSSYRQVDRTRGARRGRSASIYLCVLRHFCCDANKNMSYSGNVKEKKKRKR